MKTKILTTLMITTLFIFCRSQTVEPISLTNYPNFYNQTIGRLNIVIPNKTNYYGQPLSVFLQALSQNNLNIKAYDPAPFHDNLLELMFINDSESITNIWQNNYVEPQIKVTFQQPYDFQQSQTILNQYHWFWNTTSENFYKNLIVKKIEFYYVSGLTDKNSPPK